MPPMHLHSDATPCSASQLLSIKCCRKRAVAWKPQVEGPIIKDRDISADIEALARIAARLAGRDPDERLTIRLADVTAFNGAIWRYPDFVKRAEAAYEILRSDRAPGS